MFIFSVKRNLNQDMINSFASFMKHYEEPFGYSISTFQRPKNKHFLGETDENKRTIVVVWDKHTTEYMLYMALWHELAHAYIENNKERFTFLNKGSMGKYGKLSHETIASEVQKNCCEFFTGYCFEAKYERKFPTYFKVAKKYKKIIKEITNFIIKIN